VSRREFLKRTAAVAAMPTIISAAALGRGGAVAPNDRIVMGCIGTGGKGMDNMRIFMGNPEVQIVAVCDVDKSRCDAALAEVEKHYGAAKASGEWKGCTAHNDFRELLARDDINAVSIATPDHWHALPSIAAADAGMDIYCEKPLANSIAEGRAICDAVTRNGRVLQTGSHERSNERIRFACELVRNGRLGKLRTIRINLPCSDSHHKQAMALTTVPPPEPVPAGLDWDFWLGHTPLVPYTPLRCHFWWRFILAYGGGEMTDRGAHIIDIAQLGAGKDDTGPVHIDATGTHSTTSLYDAFFDYRFVNTYADGLELIGENRDPRGLRFEGDEGWVLVNIHGGALEAEPASLLEEKIGDDEIHLGRSPGHHRNFLDCVKSRELPMASAEVGHRTATICHLNNIAMLTGSALDWDPKREVIENNPDAGWRVRPTMRAPWHL
jgi:predicted dehydrogenase